MLILYKRHLPTCGKTNRLAGFGKKDLCRCPIWIEGTHDGAYRRHSLKTNSLAEAERKKQKILTGDEPTKPSQTSSATSTVTALEEFITDCERRGLSHSTLRKYRTLKKHLEDFARGRIAAISDFNAEAVRSFNAGRKLSLIASQKELQHLRTFFNYCLERDWLTKNPAKQIRPPKVKPNPRLPFSEKEVQAILAKAEDDRELAFLLTLRHTGLRIGDAALLKTSHFSNGGIHLRTTKAGTPVSIPTPPMLTTLLKALTPKGGYFFLRGESTHLHTAPDLWRKRIKAICKDVSISPDHPHRFRHTLACDLLTKGASVEDVAAILGNSPAVVAKHYSQWIASRQQRLDEIVKQTWQASLRRVK